MEKLLEAKNNNFIRNPSKGIKVSEKRRRSRNRPSGR
jgi:hypothetical protein